MENLYVMQGYSKIEIVHELLSSSEMTGSLLKLAIEWRTIHVGKEIKFSPLIMTYTKIFSPGPGSIISGTFHTNMEYPYLNHLLNLTYIDKETYLLWKNLLTVGSSSYI